ncbi:hypothetical protein [Nocardia violaceofusca]|uniref:hypothetical protein n=1 Tax=Nocardia violaceofusca TaxID=941182 RepID=UPI0007A5600C|nr:hypothetical protein [Nocardia violaceofusca]
MIVVAYISTFNGDVTDAVSVDYVPAHDTDYGRRQPAYVRIQVTDSPDHCAYVGMAIDEARQLVASLMSIVMLHDAAERVAAEKAVA